jgi:hypothetical protein
MVMKVSVRPLRSRADELMMSPFRRIEVGAMVGARGAIIMVWSEVIQLAKSDVRARRGVHSTPYRTTLLGTCQFVQDAGAATGRPVFNTHCFACRMCRPARRVSPSASVRLCAAQSCPCRLVGVAARCTCPRWGESILLYILYSSAQ